MRKTTHFQADNQSACGRAPGGTTNTFAVTCGSCILRNSFQDAHEKAKREKKAAFEAQVPRKFAEPWKDGNITCPCGSDLFRHADRTCYGHYDNWVCASCGSNQSRLTETGMSF